MKVCFYTDVHWSQNSSIVRGRGERYSTRLENLIKSVNWAEQLAFSCGCSAVICGGDFFDASQLNSEEISALREVEWAPISHVFITGNHESNVSNLEYSTLELFNLCQNCVVMNTPQQYFVDGANGVEFCFMPYVLERDRKTLKEYFGEKTSKRIIFSHNDIKDVQYGQFLSTEGFPVAEIEENCDLYLNGHIHHCTCVTDKIINGGNLTGQNFTEDSTKFEHCALIIDTETLKVDFYRNPFALNFYKLDYTDAQTSDVIKNRFKALKPNAVVTVKVMDFFVNDTRKILSEESLGIVDYRVLMEVQQKEVTEDGVEIDIGESTDHLQMFKEYVLENIGKTEAIVSELSEIMG